MIGRFAYVALVVEDPEAVAVAFERDLGLRRVPRRVPLFPVGRSALVLLPPGDPLAEGRSRAGVDHLALGVPDPREAAAASGLAVVGEGAGLEGARRVGLDPGATAGVRIYLDAPLDLPAPAPGMVERIDHLGVASADNGAALEAFVGRLGFPLESTQTDLEVRIAIESFTSDRYGVVHHARPPEPAGGLRVAFVTVGDAELEFLQEFDPRTGTRVTPGVPGTTRQDQGAIGRFIATRGAGLHHLALKVGDIDRALTALGRAGHTLIDRAGRPGSRRALIGFIHPRSLGGVLVHLVERGESPTA